jgi:hypothetical protein
MTDVLNGLDGLEGLKGLKMRKVRNIRSREAVRLGSPNGCRDHQLPSSPITVLATS